jgi:hypothetical protein
MRSIGSPSLVVAALGLVVAASGCGATVVVEAEPVPAPTCDGALCFEPEAVSRLADTTDALEACVIDPAREDGSPDGLRIGGVMLLGSTDTDVSLRLVLANVAPHPVNSYPGLRLTVSRAGAPTATFDGATFFAIFPCTTQEFDQTLAWDLVEGAELELAATSSLGTLVHDSIAFTVRR